MTSSLHADSGHGVSTARRGGLIDQVIDTLRAQISAGAWPIGTKIPPEPDLVERTGVGRNTVREAVQALVHAGLLERRQGSGTYVRAVSELAGPASRRFAAAAQSDVAEVRRALEVEAARLAAARRTPADVEQLQALLSARRDAHAAVSLPAAGDPPPSPGELDDLVRADVAVHRGLVAAAHNPVLTELYEHLLDALEANVRHNLVHGETDDDHAALIEAVSVGDADTAAAEVGRYLRTPPAG